MDIIAGIGAVGAALCGIEVKGAGSILCDLAGGVGGTSAEDFPEFAASRSQLESKFKHAAAFGVAEPRGAAGFDAFGKTVKSFADDSSTIRVSGTYHGESAILSYNPTTRLVVVQTPSGGFWTGFRMSTQQLWHVAHEGRLGGG
ncbi:MAG TPA: colicin D domain-containing protein [Streptosporangiaceae bacterium]|nr:colicin D domain-containing protein [Streptosporangiaceae bacterium]